MTASHLDVRVLPVRRLPPQGVGGVGAEVGQREDLVTLHQDRVLPGRLPGGHIVMVMGIDYGGQELGNSLESENWVLKKTIKSVRELIQLFLCYLIHPRSGSLKVSTETARRMFAPNSPLVLQPLGLDVHEVAARDVRELDLDQSEVSTVASADSGPITAHLDGGGGDLQQPDVVLGVPVRQLLARPRAAARVAGVAAAAGGGGVAAAVVAAAGGVAAGGRQLGGGAGVGVAAHPQHAALVTSRVTPLLAITILKAFK